jgi:UDP-N-acetylmuramate--alanine ligase
VFDQLQRVHFIGIGGIGMSAIAELMLTKKITISGSDLELTPITEHLQARGATIYEGHAYDQVPDCDAVVYTAAIPGDNPELCAARDKNITLIPRAKMLGMVMEKIETSISIAGTHGKTTTTSMVGTLLIEAGLEPTLIVGGVVTNLDVNAVLGAGRVVVAEADEYDRSFLQLSQTYSVITNIELDHMDCYRDADDLCGAFAQFANATSGQGCVIACLDHPMVHDTLPQIQGKVLTYGVHPDADYRISAIRYEALQTHFSVQHRDKELGEITLQVPGEHNATNALAAVVLGIEMGLSFPVIQRGLAGFRGVQRRFEIKGHFQDILVVDDYAHHPTEITATLIAAKNAYDRRLVAIFQPHLYSRTRDLYKDFGHALTHADVVVLTGIYPAREAPIPGITASLISDVAREAGHPDVHWVQDRWDLLTWLDTNGLPGDLVLTLGAGNIFQVGEAYVKSLS